MYKLNICSKTPIIFAKKNNVSIINNDEVNPTGHFVLQHWKNQGYSPVVVNEVTSWRNLLNEKDNVEIVKILESLSKLTFLINYFRCS